MILVKLWMHISSEEQEALQAAREGPAQVLEADRGGLAQPREAPRVRAGDRGHDRPHRPAAIRLAPDRGDSKRYARVKVIETVIAEMERGCEAAGWSRRHLARGSELRGREGEAAAVMQ